ncbi:MAG: hypothetical protein HYX68_23435 [Planctomycetes bacterium]|nr:hypothetical protein [Planctomycetota bacterium]
MVVKKLLYTVLALSILTSTGCCRMWENWCHRPNYYQGAAPYCQPAPPQCCPPGSYSSPVGAAVPVPPSAPTNWQRCP